MGNSEMQKAKSAANKLLKQSGYDWNGKRAKNKRDLKLRPLVPLKPATPIDFPEGLSKRERSQMRRQVMVERGEAFINEHGELVTAVEQEIRRNRFLAKRKRIENAERGLGAPSAKQAAREAKEARHREHMAMQQVEHQKAVSERRARSIYKMNEDMRREKEERVAKALKASQSEQTTPVNPAKKAPTPKPLPTVVVRKILLTPPQK